MILTFSMLVAGKAELEFEVRKRRKQAVALVQLSEITSTEFGVKKVCWIENSVFYLNTFIFIVLLRQCNVF
jgi:hypothetical protein